jgi:hypothetical protein
MHVRTHILEIIPYEDFISALLGVKSYGDTKNKEDLDLPLIFFRRNPIQNFSR